MGGINRRDAAAPPSHRRLAAGSHCVQDHGLPCFQRWSIISPGIQGARSPQPAGDVSAQLRQSFL